MKLYFPIHGIKLIHNDGQELIHTIPAAICADNSTALMFKNVNEIYHSI